MNIFRLAALTSVLCFCLSCDSTTLYKAYEDIDEGQWFLDKKYTFSFEVNDTTQQYNLYYLIRNGQQYPYYNLYINREMTGPDGPWMTPRLDEVYLSDEKTGKPLGSGLGDLFDHKIIFMRKYQFPKTGTYTLTFSQAMRQNPLPFVLGIGLSVEKVESEQP
ncbi:gliding motility lipoprotein GldH [Arundinibacter roseus]|uniref:Gliding motility lipoprotein GldH n=1 Tax=Arundinibacter roseus TaxID=2070510 RepID=A0A4R4KLA9_9BACT|nr:gliding motility lipoprotein GldH [Arundinibacter roseus]TDB69130.1 gliding motility lipoprotein GldH [Arundinibacter roseus]